MPNEPAFKVLAFYSTNVEPDHVHVANDALALLQELAAKDNFVFDTTTDWDKLNDEGLEALSGDYCGSMIFRTHPRSAPRLRNTWNTVEGGWVPTWPDTTMSPRSGRGLWIFWEARCFTPTTGRHCLRN